MKMNLKRHKAIQLDEKESQSHSEMQFFLAKLGNSPGYHVWIDEFSTMQTKAFDLFPLFSQKLR
ncbi:hypothetical protein [Terrilactibacillus laevilacticus]|uniref:hypothetical protein n=1 Tax=Terrilactibacillus laevilacticus TaxID=1380157 RepID=UPI0011463DD3|nr:hypothetical protein [Terrilactibacillus laevilacticus]